MHRNAFKLLANFWTVPHRATMRNCKEGTEEKLKGLRTDLYSKGNIVHKSSHHKFQANDKQFHLCFGNPEELCARSHGNMGVQWQFQKFNNVQKLKNAKTRTALQSSNTKKWYDYQCVEEIPSQHSSQIDNQHTNLQIKKLWYVCTMAIAFNLTRQPCHL